ncbi:uncharacterized protein SETTUDRAFT_19298 [Exserohilum turcica Et28A]|uniref:Uncharacterized protein n=1 Tax=Exserohilum turcicum (strain 28A) TaxID=671987 RepID=R0IP92_EXST2|nr:uncharacterized protein SETTUDRAFT_19298 [Exserohilum turcica Et28A]EOA86775.1 hypothetical protein SETTUDRAFT_19298 [Exserohilum turcica Et28A]
MCGAVEGAQELSSQLGRYAGRVVKVREEGEVVAEGALGVLADLLVAVHWRYISSFHGPWLQLPPEVLESLAHSNYLSPRPHPIDPAVFYDLVKIRKAVDEATTLAVRATSGLTSAALSNSLHGANSMLGSAAALGIGYGGGGGGGTSKLSRERKHRMRELATSKLSQAYHLDEIAASVATMQSASTLEDVAHLVLQREPSNVDAKYVHFFHEKIPSRMMAQCTPLDTLNDIIAERPHDGSPLRTRALTRIFKDDYVNSAKDLSEALSAARYTVAQHRAARDQLVLAKTLQDHCARDWRQQVRIADDDQPSSLESQLLFHRAGVYFTIACSHVHSALDGLGDAQQAKARRAAMVAEGKEPEPMTPHEAHASHVRLEARSIAPPFPDKTHLLRQMMSADVEASGAAAAAAFFLAAGPASPAGGALSLFFLRAIVSRARARSLFLSSLAAGGDAACAPTADLLSRKTCDETLHAAQS